MARGAREERVEPQVVVDVASDVENIAHQVNGNRQAANNSGPREHSSLAPSAKHEKEAFEESMAAHEAHILNTQRAGTNFCRGKLLLKYDSISLERSFLKQKIMERIPVVCTHNFFSFYMHQFWYSLISVSPDACVSLSHVRRRGADQSHERCWNVCRSRVRRVCSYRQESICLRHSRLSCCYLRLLFSASNYCRWSKFCGDGCSLENCDDRFDPRHLSSRDPWFSFWDPV